MGFLKSKGEKVFFVLFLACACTGALLLTTIFIFQMGNENIATISVTGAQQAKVSNGRIFVRWDAGGTGYALYDNVTFAKLGERTSTALWSSYSQITPVGDLIYSASGNPHRGTVELWSASHTVLDNASISFSDAAASVCVQGNYAYFGLGNKSVAIVNASQAPSSLTFINGTPNMGITPSKIMVFGGFVFACDPDQGMVVCNVTNVSCPGTPKRILGTPSDFGIRSNYLYAVGKYGNLTIYDISSPLAPVYVSWKNITNGDKGNDLNGICLTTRGSEVLALIALDTGFAVVDVTTAATPVLLGIKTVRIGSAQGQVYAIAADAERVYVANALGVAILSKTILTPVNLGNYIYAYSLGEILVIICMMVLCLCVFFGAGFLWKREKGIARLKGNDLWIARGTVIRTVVLFFVVVPISALMSLRMGMDMISMGLYGLIEAGILSVVPLYMYQRQRRLGKGGEAGLSKEQLLERLQAEKNARAKAEEEGRRKGDEERKKRESEKETKQQAKEDAKRRQAEEEARKKTEQEEMRMRKLQQIVKVSARLPIDRIAQMLEMDSEEVWKRVLDWAERFHFTIDGQDLIFNKETVNDFISSLDKEFKQWGKEGKV